MTKQDFIHLTAKGPILLDGATGSQLISAGMPRGICSEQWILEHPQIFMDLQRSYVQAGSQIVYAPTFTCNRYNMETFSLADCVEEMNHALVSLSRQAVGNSCLIAGDLTTTGQMLSPRGTMTYEFLFELYREQISYLMDAGVDLLIAETMLGVEETVALLDAANSLCDLPVMCSLSLEADGSALYDGNAQEMVETLQEMGASAVGLNCSVGPDQLEAVVASMARVSRIPILAKPDAGLPKISETGEACYPMTPTDFARHMKVLIQAGAGLVGGCCGTGPEYICALKKMIQEGI